MHDIPTANEAVKAIDDVMEGLKVLRRFVEGTQAIFAPAQQRSLPLTTRPSPANGAPATWLERIMKILKDSGMAMSPAQITTEYTRREWPKPSNGKISNSVRSNLYFAKTRKLVSHNAERGTYTASVTPEDIAPTVIRDGGGPDP